MRRGKCGQIRVIEAFLAVTIVFSAIAISSKIMDANIHRDVIDNNNLAFSGMNVLFILDQDGSLCRYIESRNWTSLGEALRLLLPTSVIFNVTIYDENMRQINTERITSGEFNSLNIVLVEYICTNRNPSCFGYYVIYLYLGRAGS